MEKGPSKRTHRQSEWHKRKAQEMKWNVQCLPLPLTPPACVCVRWGIRKHLPIHTAPLHMHIRIRDDDSQTIFIGKLYLFLLPKAKAECGHGGRGATVGSGLGKFQHQQHFGWIYTRISVRASVRICVCASGTSPCFSVSLFVPLPVPHKVNGLRFLGFYV